ncbi:MAG: hypothetical protein KGD63_10270 [Candidatus Lokiarchaeota archaeon]|nr:hypothetical protein [Candidatus Lokiarchaeota archaeon]
MTTPLSTPKLPINVIQRFEDFYRLFEDSPGDYKYQQQIKDISAKGGNSLLIFYEDLLSYDLDIAEMLKQDPAPLIEDAIKAFKNLLKFQSSETNGYKDYFVRFSTKDEKSPISISIRGLRSKHIDKLVCINGITIRSSVVRPKLINGVFECIVCGSTFDVLQLTSSIRWPNFCINKRCKAKARSDFRLITKKSDFIDWQSITIQEVPEDLPPGRIPRSVQAVLTHDLVDYVKPGDRIKLIGIYKSVLATSMNSNNSNLFKTFTEANYIDPEDKSEEHLDITKEEKIEIERLSKEPFIQRKITRSIAPTIYGRDELKMACALSLFAGTRKKKKGGGYKRGDIHVLFVGDPGTGKSIHGSEKIYVGIENSDEKIWDIRSIGDFVDELFDQNPSKIILKEDSEILKLDNLPKNYTYSINTDNFKTQISQINEVSRHKAEILIQIKTKNGREILATPNHSFTTLLNGKLEVIDANQLYEMKNSINQFKSKKKYYLPVARDIKFDINNQKINMAAFINKKEIQSSIKINKNLSLYQEGIISFNNAAINSSITKSTLLLYKKDPISLPDGDWIRKKRNNNWIPYNITYNEEFGRIIGFYIAEGSISKNSVRITNTYPDVIKLLEKDIKSIFNKVSIYDYENTIQIHNSIFTKWIQKFCGNYAKYKKISSQFLFTPNLFRRGLLSAYFTGDSYIKKNKLYIESSTASKELAYNLLDMLCSFSIFASIGLKEIKSGKFKGNIYYNIILTGEEVIKYYKKIGFLIRDKQTRLKKSIDIASQTSRYQKKDIIPNFGNLLKNIVKDLEISDQRGTWIRSFYAELRGKTQRQRVGRKYLCKVIEKLELLYNKKKKEYSNDLEWLRSLSESDILWDEIEKINFIKKSCYVYDIGTEDHHFIVANGNLIVHNSEILKSAVDISPRGLYTSGKGSTAVGLTAAVIKDNDTGQMNLEAGAIVLANGGIAAIDEFDKMSTADRSALHEAMEQQSYHYNTEIQTTNGERILIGEFVDNLMEQNNENILHCNECEILNYKDLELYTSDFNKIYKTKIDRISRHKAPDYFYKFKFTNGRSIIVTPEHPMFAYRNEKLQCISADQCYVNDFIPIPKYLPNSSKSISLKDLDENPHPLSKKILIPQYLDEKLSTILGYLVSEGYIYLGRAAEIGFSNMDKILLDDFEKLMKMIFDITPTLNIREDGLITLRYISIELYKWMICNFPEIMKISKLKRIPKKVLAGSVDIAKKFLKSAFRGDGSVESIAIYYRTSSIGLSHDYQDLLLKLGIQSRITFDKHNNSYKVYIRAQSFSEFFDKIVEKNDKRFLKIKKLTNPTAVRTYHHDIFPTSFMNQLIRIKKILAIPDNSYYWCHFKEKYGITRDKITDEIGLIQTRLNLFKNSISGGSNIIDLRKKLEYSQYLLSKISGLSRGTIDYYERGGYSQSKRSKIKIEIISSLKNLTNHIQEKLKSIIKFVDAEILWDRIKKIEIIENKNNNYFPWVYDLTVEPNHTFISQGIILHNTVSIAKAGIVATLKAETAIISAANPHSGRYDIYKTPTQNIRLPPSLLSRFDLIFVVVDRPNKVEDAQMAEFILQSAMINAENEDIDNDKNENFAPISSELLKKYIKHAKRTCRPILTKAAKKHIKEFYLKLRGEYSSEDAIISILARNLDALVRLSESHAKMALREKVQKEDVVEIIKLFRRYLRDTGYDETTGKIDMDRIFAGESRSKLNKLDKLLTRLKEIFEENDWKMLERKGITQILDLEESLEEDYIKKAIDNLIDEGTLYKPKTGYIKFTRND